MTCVYEARECETDTGCALKVLREGWQDPATAIKLASPAFIDEC